MIFLDNLDNKAAQARASVSRVGQNDVNLEKCRTPAVAPGSWVRLFPAATICIRAPTFIESAANTITRYLCRSKMVPLVIDVVVLFRPALWKVE